VRLEEGEDLLAAGLFRLLPLAAEPPLRQPPHHGRGGSRAHAEPARSRLLADHPAAIVAVDRVEGEIVAAVHEIDRGLIGHAAPFRLALPVVRLD
jgi:hypothetical protein